MKGSGRIIDGRMMVGSRKEGGRVTEREWQNKERQDEGGTAKGRRQGDGKGMAE